MRPDARVASAIEILDQWLASSGSLDRILTQWARNNRYAGSGDRAAIADLAYGALRRLRSANWRAGGREPPNGRNLLHGALLLDGEDPKDFFTGTRHAPDTLTEAEIAGRLPVEDAARAVRLDYPDWLEPYFASIDDAELQALKDRAATDLRVNTLKTNVDRAIAALASDGISVEPVAGAPLALRVTAGARKVARSDAYLDGLVEIQDAGSQLLAGLARAAPGELVIDLCAGGGGKSLAIAAQSDGSAVIKTHDISLERMKDIPGRAARAGVSIECLESSALSQYLGQADLVFVDAPCSGSGAWRRNPDAKWRLTPERLDELTLVQRRLLSQAVELCRPTGRIVYGTCSIFDIENMRQVDAFLTEFSDWHMSKTFQTILTMRMDGLFGAVLSQVLDSRTD